MVALQSWRCFARKLIAEEYIKEVREGFYSVITFFMI